MRRYAGFPGVNGGVDLGGGSGEADAFLEGVAVGVVDVLAEPTDLLVDAEHGVAIVAVLTHEVEIGAEDAEFFGLGGWGVEELSFGSGGGIQLLERQDVAPPGR